MVHIHLNRFGGSCFVLLFMFYVVLEVIKCLVVTTGLEWSARDKISVGFGSGVGFICYCGFD